VAYHYYTVIYNIQWHTV